ncbi:MAG: D-tyrosyl-tRNA(Tyr) deacylase [Deltaproteobacteria bacterium]|nr:D-tyrosyl-tRNA(Tyr) deacylase [Deltaproteobacteria bacterium]
MKFVIQRVSKAGVTINKTQRRAMGAGLVVFMGIHKDDRVEDCGKWIEKILNLRIFADEQKPINRSVRDINGEVLLISQFTLYGDCKGQNRPSFINAAKPDVARVIYDAFETQLRQAWPKTTSGEFAAHMDVDLVNDGPVTIILE